MHASTIIRGLECDLLPTFPRSICISWIEFGVSFGCDVTSGKQNCVEFGVVYWIHGSNAGMFLGENITAPIWQSILHMSNL